MLSMNILCSSGFLTNSFMMKLHEILNLLLPAAAAAAAFILTTTIPTWKRSADEKISHISRCYLRLFYYHNGCTQSRHEILMRRSCNFQGLDGKMEFPSSRGRGKA